MTAPNEDLNDFPQVDDVVKKQEKMPVRRLGPSKKQKAIEKKSNPADIIGEDVSKEEEEEDASATLHTGVLAKLNLPPTNILSKYSGSTANGDDSKDEIKNEQADDGVIRTDLETEMQAWDAVEQVRATETVDVQESDGGITNKKDDSSSDISYNQALAFLEKGSDERKDKIKIYDFRNIGWMKSVQYSIFGKPTLNKALTCERDLIFCIAATSCNYDHVEHERIFQTIYRKLTGDALQCPRLGSHWQLIGFQGTDPATDIRSQGMLGPLQLLYMLHKYHSLALKILQLSKDEVQHFPFCVVGMNITGMCIQSLREGGLYKKIKMRKSTYNVVNELYVSIWLEFYRNWRKNASTIMDFDALRQTLMAESRLRPRKLMRALKRNQSSEKHEEQLEFTEIG